MKKLLSLFICLSALFMYSCSSDDDDNDGKELPNNLINYTIKYQDDQYDEHADKGTKIYIFSGLTLSDVKEYKGAGVVVLQDDKTKSYTKTVTTGNDGKATITGLEVSQNYIQYIESAGLSGLIYRSAFITEASAKTYTRDHVFKYDDYLNLNK